MAAAVPDPGDDGDARDEAVRVSAVTLRRTDSGWKGESDDGRAVYVRLRRGHLSVGVAETLDEAIDREVKAGLEFMQPRRKGKPA